MIKLVVSDVDGTLVKEGGSVLNPAIIQIILKLKEKGITFVAASGRQYFSMEHLFESIKNDIYFVSSNGGFVMYQGEVLERRCMEQETLEEIVKFCRRQPDSFYLITTPESDYTDCDDLDFVRRLREEYRIKIQKVEDVLKLEKDILKVSIYGKTIDAVVMGQRARDCLGDSLSILPAGDHWVDIMRAGADKGAAIESIQKRLHISSEETIAFGDNMNDIGMFRVAKESYAVATARPQVKGAAKHVLTELAEEGVLQVLRTLL